MTATETMPQFAGGVEVDDCFRVDADYNEELLAFGAVDLAGAPANTCLEVIFEPTGAAWLPVAVFSSRRGQCGASDVVGQG